MTTFPDHIEAVINYLKADPEVAGLVGTKVFGGELPEGEVAGMPTRAIVVASNGSPGVFGAGYQDYGDQALRVAVWGQQPYHSMELHRAVYTALKTLRRSVQGTVLLHWARPSSGILPLRDPDTDWPYTVSTWQLLVAEIQAT